MLRNKPADKGYPTVSEIDGVPYYQGVGGGPQATFTENMTKLFKMKNYWLIAIYAFVIYGTVMGFQGLWCIPYLQQIYGLTKQQAANILMCWPIGMALGCLAIGWASDPSPQVAPEGILLWDYCLCDLMAAVSSCGLVQFL